MQHLDVYMSLLAKKIEKWDISGKDVDNYCITDSGFYVSITCNNWFTHSPLMVYLALTLTFHYLDKQTLPDNQWTTIKDKY